MTKRIWDPSNKFPGGTIKVYNHWSLEISYRQHTLGCFIVFAKREIENMSELTNNELLELRHVMQEVETTLQHIPELCPDKFNYLQLGNSMRHLHIHGIPRYKTPRQIFGKTWIDTTWGKPPLWSSVNEDTNLVKQMRDKIVSHYPAK